jgi:hypothetical protein
MNGRKGSAVDWAARWVIAMRNEPVSTRLRLGLMACACGVLLALGSAMSAQAQTQAVEEEEDTFEQSIIKNILGGMGVDVGRPGIDYRERSPLVIPPTLDLPPPASAGLAASNPAWPREPVQQKKAVKRTHARATSEDPGTNAAMTPEEMRLGTNPRAARTVDPRQTNATNDLETGRPLTPGEMKSGSIFTWGNLMGSNRETATFTGEPTRGSLTQPPPGYQTPSTNQPYAAGQERGGGWKIPSILDRPVGTE